jgi:hypothetical protein
MYKIRHDLIKRLVLMSLVSAMLLFLSGIATPLGTTSKQVALADNDNDSGNSNSSSHNHKMNEKAAVSSSTDNGSLQIRIEEVTQLPRHTPNATTISEKCERNNVTGGFSQDCERKVIGRTNNLGQILIFNNTARVIPMPPRVTSYVIVTVTDGGNGSRPVKNAIIDGTVDYASRFGVDAGSITITSAFIHALKPDMSDWADINWTAPQQ